MQLGAKGECPLSATDTSSIKSWKDRLPTFIAITTLVLAVCATLATFKAAGYGNRMVLAQSQASDQWAYYQAKSIKETAYQTQRDAMQLLAEQFPSDKTTKRLAEYDQEIARYKQEKKEIQDEAKRLEAVRDKAQQFNSLFGQALIFLQIGILLSSLSAINKVPYYWYLGSACGSAGVAYFLYTVFFFQ